MIDKSIIVPLIETHFRTRKTQFKEGEIDSSESLVRLGVLIELPKSNRILELNNNSSKFNDALLAVAENKLNKSMPKNISEAFKFIDEFDEYLKEEYDFKRILNAYSYIIEGLNGYVLGKLSNDYNIDVKAFLDSLQDEDKRESHLSSFEENFFKFLPFSNYKEQEIIVICEKLWNNKRYRHDVIKFLRDFANHDIEKSKNVLKYSIDNKISTSFISDLLIGLYNAGDNEALVEAIKLKVNDKIASLGILGRLKYRSIDDINSAFGNISPLDLENEKVARQQSYFIVNLLENSITSTEIIDKCFNYLVNFLQEGTDDVVKTVFYDISHYIKEFEDRKYDLLLLYINKTGDFNVLKNFFYHFTEPKYIFDLMARLFEQKPDFYFSLKLFEDGLRHLWKKSPIKSEESTLNLFKYHPRYGLLAVKVLLSAYRGTYFIDLLKLDKKEYQITAIKSICKQPIAFDELLKVLLPLRNSDFPEVREFLQEKLSKKVFTSYHDVLYTKIEELVDESKNDMVFLKPIKKALDDYHKMKKLKASIKDLDPRENERSLMDLYYRLEHEEQAKAMEESKSGKGTFLEMMKNVTIVRGNSMKHNDREPMKMAKIESSVLVDGIKYVNPDLYVMNLDNLE